jgi:hypothetical protein
MVAFISGGESQPLMKLQQDQNELEAQEEAQEEALYAQVLKDGVWWFTQCQ